MKSGGEVGKSLAFWPDTGEGPWELTFEWGEVDGRAQCVGFAIRWADKAAPRSSDDPAHRPLWAQERRAVTTTLLRSVPFGSLVQDERRRSRWVGEVVAGLGELPASERRAAQARASKFAGRPGRPALYGDVHFREVAAVYAAAFKQGLAPTAAVHEHFGNLHLSRSAIAKHVAKARELGFLGKTVERRAGGVQVPSKKKGSK